MVIYYHNPRCSKSREGLKIIQKAKLKVQIKEYLKEAISESELKSLLKKLDKPVTSIIRKKESLYKEMNLQEELLSESDYINLICKTPQLLERPILVINEKAVIGRPSEEISKLIKEAHI